MSALSIVETQALITLIEDDPEFPVNARDLHAFLEVGKVFGAWIQERIKKYEFLEHHDFRVFSRFGKNPQGGRPSLEYHLTLDMAKELSMVENNERGRQARRYFIACEKKLRNVLEIPTATKDAPKFGKYAETDWAGVARIHAAYKRLVRSRKLPVAAQAAVADFAVESITGIPIGQILNEAIRRIRETAPELLVPERKAATHTGTSTRQNVNRQLDLEIAGGPDIALSPDAKLTAGDLGAIFGGYPAQNFNKLLYALGYQEPENTRGNRLRWRPTAKGEPYAVSAFVPRSGSVGSDVPQLVWKASLLDALRADPGAQKIHPIGGHH